MDDPFKRIYDDIAERKDEASAIGPYMGGNGRIDRAVSLIKTSQKFPLGGTLLDVGGATGNLGYALRDRFEKRIVVDIVESCRVPAESKGNEFFCGNVDSCGLPIAADETVDLITALDVIEHIIDPQSFARECRRVLKPGGVILVNTPNIQFWRHLDSLVVRGEFPHTSGDREVYHGGHVAFYNLRDMYSIFEHFTGHEMHVDGLPCDPPPPIWAQLFQWPDKQDKMRQLSYGDLIFSCRKPT